MSNPYRMLGLGFCLAGIIFAPISYFVINSVPLTAVGISVIVIGFTCIALANARPYISPEASQLMLETGMENTAALLEELGLRSKAIYLPSTMRDGHPQALIPLGQDKDIQWIRDKIPGRLIVRYGVDPEDMAIAVTTPGSTNIEMLETRPGPTASDIESAVTYILTGVLDIANSVTMNLADGRVDAEISGSRLHYENVWYYRCLGSPIASIVATIASEALQKPIRILEESYDKGKSRIIQQLLVHSLRMAQEMVTFISPAKYLNTPDVAKLRANINRLRSTDSEAAKTLSQLLQLEYDNLDNNARLNPATEALSQVFSKVDKQSNIVIISRHNHDAEALAFNAFSYTKRGNSVITI